MSARLNTLSQDFTRVGTSLIALGAIPTLALVGATKAAIDFESSFAGIRKTVDASEAEFAQLSANIRNLAKETPLAVNELNRIGELAGQLGIRGVDNLTKFTKTIAELGVTTMLTEEAAAMSLARIINIMQEPVDNISNMGSVIVDLGNKFATTEPEIMNFAERVAGAGRIAGLTTGEIFAIGAAFSSVGIEAEAGGTAVQKVLIEMTKASTTGSDKLESFAKVAGLSSIEFQKAFKEDASKAFQLFVEGIAARGDEATAVFDEIEMKDVRLVRSFLSLANAGDLLGRTFDVQNVAWEQNTALTTEAEKRYKTTASQIQIAKNNLYDLGITIGSSVLPAFNSILQALKPVIEAFANFAAKHPQLVVAMLLIGAALGTLGIALVAIGMILPGLGVMMGIFGAISLAALWPILVPIALIGAAVALLYATWTNNWGGIQEKTQAVVDWFVNVAWPAIQSFFTYIWNVILLFVAIWQLQWAIIRDVTMLVVNWFWSWAGPTITAFFNFVVAAIKVWAEEWRARFQLIKAIVEAVVNWFMSYVWPTISKVFGWLAEKAMWLYGQVKQAFDWIKQKVDEVISYIGNLINNFRPKITIGLDLPNVEEAWNNLKVRARAVGVPGFQTGGVVPGPIGAPVLATVHGGEIISPNSRSGGGEEGGSIFNVYVGMYAGTETEKRNIARDLYAALVQVASSQNKTVQELMHG